MAYIAATCPNCGAATDGMPRTECEYCQADLVVTSTPLPDPPPDYIQGSSAPSAPIQPQEPLSNRRVIGLLIITLAVMYPVLLSYIVENGHMPIDLEWAVLAAVVSAISIAILWGRQRRTLSTVLLFTIGATLFFKPLIAPYRSTWEPDMGIPYSFDSETHMFFWVPGGLLLLVPFFWFFFVRSSEDSDNAS